MEGAVEDRDRQLREEQAAVREWRKGAKEKEMRVRAAERAVAELEKRAVLETEGEAVGG